VTDAIDLTPVQQRVVGALVEKELTTPDNYPLSMNALLAACNQTTNREPVVSFDEKTVGNALENLKANGVTRVVYSKGMRVDKYRHVLHEKLQLDKAELALLAVLMLRGPQTAAELRSRTERMHAFDGQDELDRTLERLADRDLATLLPRQPGQKGQRWAHRLGAAPSVAEVAPPQPPSPAAELVMSPSPSPSPPGPDRLAELEARVAALEDRLDQAGL
jgi:uncharacterized protein YceH (UPF0502 family)